jgi:hypothetical protein
MRDTRIRRAIIILFVIMVVSGQHQTPTARISTARESVECFRGGVFKVQTVFAQISLGNVFSVFS